MKGSTPVMRMFRWFALSAALAACSGSPLAPADDPAVNLAKGGATVTDFTASDVATGLVDPGLMEPRDEYMVMRGMVVTTRITAFESDLSYLTCDSRLTINANLLLADGTGSMWGKVECVPLSGGGMWLGSWTGKREMTSATPLTWLTTMKIVLQGRGGDIDGLQVRAQEVNELKATDPWYPGPVLGPFSLAPIGAISGMVLDPR